MAWELQKVSTSFVKWGWQSRWVAVRPGQSNSSVSPWVCWLTPAGLVNAANLKLAICKVFFFFIFFHTIQYWLFYTRDPTLSHQCVTGLQGKTNICQCQACLSNHPWGSLLCQYCLNWRVYFIWITCDLIRDVPIWFFTTFHAGEAHLWLQRGLHSRGDKIETIAKFNCVRSRESHGQLEGTALGDGWGIGQSWKQLHKQTGGGKSKGKLGLRFCRWAWQRKQQKRTDNKDGHEISTSDGSSKAMRWVKEEKG